jgi:hypothetical protein
MDFILYEDSPKYDRWVKLLLVFPVVLLLVMGFLFYVDASYRDLFPKEPQKESLIAAYVLFGNVIFVLFIYWLVLPHKIYILQDRIRLKWGQFFLNIPFEKIESIKAAKGIIAWFTISFITSYSRQVNIAKKCGLKIRISPSNREQFLEYSNRAIADWKRTHGG